jgi:hypothetical protein
MTPRSALPTALAALAISAPASAQGLPQRLPPETVPAAQAPVEAAKILDDVLKDGQVSVIRNAPSIDGVRVANRALTVKSRPRASGVPGVCEVDVLKLVATPGTGPNADVPYGPNAAVVREMAVTHLYKVPPGIPAYKPIAWPEAEARCAGLDLPSIPPGRGWFDAPHPGAARTAGEVVERLRSDLAKGPRSGLLAVCAHTKCPEAALAEQLFRLEAISAIRDTERDCPRGLFCYELSLTTPWAAAYESWTAQVATTGGTELNIKSLRLRREPTLVLD